MASVGQQPQPPASPPAAPPGWQPTWSDQHNQWYYVDIATGSSQWEYPSGPADATQHSASPQPTHQYPGQQQYPQQESASPQGDVQPEASRGLMSMAAGAVLGHEMHGHSHHSGHHNMLGSMGTLLGSAGVGALGAKLFGGKKHSQPAHNAPSASHPPFQGYPASPPPAPFYPAQSPPPPVHTGPGYYAMGAGAAAGVASATAVYAVSNYPHHQYQQPPAGPGGSSGMGTLHGGPFISGPRLVVHAAAFADKDVTQRVRMLVNSEQKISVQKKMTEEFGDPWPEAGRKGLSILYQYGDRPMEVWAGSTEDEGVNIKNEALSNERMSYVNKNPGRIVCLIWGQESLLSDARVEKLETEGEMDCKDLRDGGWWAWEKRTLVCYYRGPQGGIEIGHAREGGTLRLPWNPLAKWS